jgi:hypothetical protein
MITQISHDIRDVFHVSTCQYYKLYKVKRQDQDAGTNNLDGEISLARLQIILSECIRVFLAIRQQIRLVIFPASKVSNNEDCQRCNHDD